MREGLRQLLSLEVDLRVVDEAVNGFEAIQKVRQWQPDAERWLLFNYLVLALCGLVLVLQPLPGQRSE